MPYQRAQSRQVGTGKANPDKLGFSLRYNRLNWPTDKRTNGPTGQTGSTGIRANNPYSLDNICRASS
ncbi:MAG: hypothetical protein ACR2PH_09370, partial [Desulfobulbia bacterium]